MEFWTVTLICFACAFVLVIGGALVIYMGSLVKSAYQIKIETHTDIEDGQKRVEEEVDKKIRYIKRDLVEEIEKAKAALVTDNQRKISELLDGFIRRLTECEAALTKDHTDYGQLLEGLRHDIGILDRRMRQLRRDQKPLENTDGDDTTLGTAQEAPLQKSPSSSAGAFTPFQNASSTADKADTAA